MKTVRGKAMTGEQRARAALNAAGYRPGLPIDVAAEMVRACEREFPGIPPRAWNAALHHLDAEHDLDPGPVPEVVEPETAGNITTIVVSPRAALVVTQDVGRTGLTGLTVHLGYESVTVALSVPVVDALCQALVEATPIAYELVGGSPIGGGVDEPTRDGE